MDTSVSVELFVEILNRYVYYFDQQNESVSYYYNDDGLIPVLINYCAGDNQILEWADRAHPLQPFHHPGSESCDSGKPKAAFLPNVGVH
jgi:hypothetical protein